MRYIKKGEEPKRIVEWKAQKNENWEPTWDALRGTEKTDLHDSLLREQGYICCYCQLRIAKENSHIEHLKPRHKYPDLALEYTNLLTSCQRQRSLPEHCGYHKDDWYDEKLMVSPLQENCADFFKYTESGEILPIDDPEKQAAAATTIERLGLNLSQLRASRRKVIEDILADIDTLSSEEVQLLIEGFEQPNGNGEYEEFGSVIIYILKQYFIP